MKVENKVIVVTGAGNGLGRAIVHTLLSKGSKVIAIDIDEKGLEETVKQSGIHSDDLATYILNITEREKVIKVTDDLINIFGRVDGLINNAGIIQPFMHVNEMGFEVINKIMEVNFFGTLYLTKALLPHFLKQEKAHIVNVSSLGGFMPFPGQTIYGASKAAVKLLTEGLYSELKDTHVNVTVIHPGAVRTNIIANSGVNDDFVDSSDKSRALDPNKAALMIIKAMEKNKYRATIGNDSKLLDIIYRISPKYATNLIVKKIKDLPINKH